MPEDVARRVPLPIGRMETDGDGRVAGAKNRYQISASKRPAAWVTKSCSPATSIRLKFTSKCYSGSVSRRGREESRETNLCLRGRRIFPGVWGGGAKSCSSRFLASARLGAKSGIFAGRG